MTVTVTTTAAWMRRVLTTACMVVQKRSTIPILAHAMLSAGPSGARIEVTDMEIALHLDLPAQVTGAGAFTFDARRALAALGAAADGDQVSILAHEGDKNIRFSIGPMQLLVEGLPADDFPEIVALPDDAAAFPMDPQVLRQMIARVFHAISTEETRYYLNGIYLHRVEDTLRAVATDGHRILWADAAAPKGFPQHGQIIPTGTIKLLRALLAEGQPGADDELAMRMSDVKLEVAGAGWTVISKCIDGTFPDYPRVVPDPAKLPARADIRAPAQVAAWLGAIVGGGAKSEPVLLRPGHDGALRVLAKAPTIGEASAVLSPEVAGYQGEAGKGGAFQARYLQDICHALPEGFALHLDLQHGPTAITAAEGAIRGAIMPMKYDVPEGA